MLPDGWKLVPIKEICSCIVDCVNKTAPVVDYETPYKMIRTTNVRHGRVDTKNVRYITEETYKIWTHRGNLENGDLIFTREAPVGEIGVLEDANGVFLGQRTVMYRAHLSKSNNLFILYSLQSRYCEKQIEDFSNGGTVAHVRVPDCSEIILKIPPLPEQQKIAQILSTWDKAIKKLETLITAKQKRKKALIQQLLTGKKRFAGFEGEWRPNFLGKVAEIVMGSSPKSEAYNEIGDGLPLLQGNADIKNRLSAPRIYTSEITKTCSPNDILLSVRAPVGSVARSLHKACIGRGMASIKAKNGWSQDFLYQWLLFFEQKWDRLSQGSTFESVNSADIKNLHIIFPESLEEQQKIASVLFAADKEIENHQKQLSTLKQQKKGLMQQLLTGKKRVKVNNHV